MGHSWPLSHRCITSFFAKKGVSFLLASYKVCRGPSGYARVFQRYAGSLPGVSPCVGVCKVFSRASWGVREVYSECPGVI